MQQLCILATGDTWNDEMIVMRAGMPTEDRWMATVFFVCFQLVAQFVLMNLFVMVIEDAYEVSLLNFS